MKIPRLKILLIVFALASGQCTSQRYVSVTPNGSEGATTGVGTSLPTMENAQQTRFEVLLKECLPPCWIGITPGVTESQDAERVLRDTYGEKNVHVESNTISWVSIGQTSGESSGFVTLADNNTVQDVSLQFKDGRLKVETLIGIIDKPEFIRKWIASESGCAGVSLVYIELGIEAWLYPGSQSIGVEKNQFVQSMRLSTPEWLSNLRVYDASLSQWLGYSDYCAQTP